VDFRSGIISKPVFYDNVIPHFLLVSTGAAIKLMKDYIQSQKRLSQVSLEKAETELKFLKSQINPHFVFNTLNTIYFQIDKTNSAARESLLQFSDLLRYQLYDCNADTIEIEKEMQYLHDFVQLQQKRKDENYSIEMNGSMDVKGFRITPLLLLPLVENAFKHISHFNEKQILSGYMLKRTESYFLFKVENTKEPAHISTEKKSGGIGLQNMQRRLELLYPQQHSLEISDNGDWFIVLLKLAIK
jgi:LytS/YehU family sensor histidine kinase